MGELQDMEDVVEECVRADERLPVAAVALRREGCEGGVGALKKDGLEGAEEV